MLGSLFQFRSQDAFLSKLSGSTLVQTDFRDVGVIRRGHDVGDAGGLLGKSLRRPFDEVLVACVLTSRTGMIPA